MEVTHSSCQKKKPRGDCWASVACSNPAVQRRHLCTDVFF